MNLKAAPSIVFKCIRKSVPIGRLPNLYRESEYDQKQLSEYSSVTKEDVMRVYEKYIKAKPHVILSTLAKGQEAMIAKADNYTIDTTHYKAPDYGYAGLKYVKQKIFSTEARSRNGPNRL